jgi:hypothetical protein
MTTFERYDIVVRTRDDKMHVSTKGACLVIAFNLSKFLQSTLFWSVIINIIVLLRYAVVNKRIISVSSHPCGCHPPLGTANGRQGGWLDG